MICSKFQIICIPRFQIIQILNVLKFLQTKRLPFWLLTGFYTKLNVWGSLGLNFDYDGGPIIENGGPLFLYKRRILGGSTSFRRGDWNRP